MSATQKLSIVIIIDIHDKAIFELGQHFQAAQCTIHHFNINTLGDFCHVSVLAEGSWRHIALLEVLIQELARKNQWDLKIWRQKIDAQSLSGVPYALEAIFVEDKGRTIAEIFDLIVQLNISIGSYTYQASKIDTQHLIAKMSIDMRLPYHAPIQSLRERFYHLCDALNIDGNIELCLR
jgi:glycine cleavage system regulatory protein